MSEYSEKLRDPRWQKKRLAILERENWTCQCCDNKEEELQVHHLIYSKGEPWDAPNETLECLCRTCHEWREGFNEFGWGRTLAPTRLCFTFMRFTTVLLAELKPSSKPDYCFEAFCKFWPYRRDSKS